VRIILFIGLIGLALFELRIATVAQTAYSNISASKIIQKYQQDPRQLVAYGKQAMWTGDIEIAKKWLQRALRADPLYIPAWLALGELENDTGNAVRAVEILEYVDSLMRDVIRWRWDKAMLAYLLGRNDILTADLVWLLQQEKTSGQTRQKILKFAFSLWPEPTELLRNMGLENAFRLFQHAVRTKNIETASYFWSVRSEEEQAELETKQVLPYINLLITSKKVNEAALVWNKYFPSDTLLYNGNFSQPLVKGGFGWRNWKAEGAEVERPNQTIDPPTLLHIHFTGKNNINYYHTRQLLPLPPGQSFFTLSGELKSRGLTTDQTPFIEVVGRDCSMHFATEMVQTDQDWTLFKLPFTVPEECNQGIIVRVRRRPSRNIDNLISGDLWLTKFSLQATELTEK
jgi:tetratricopeptide (TPR) repeat protein